MPEQKKALFRRIAELLGETPASAPRTCSSNFLRLRRRIGPSATGSRNSLEQVPQDFALNPVTTNKSIPLFRSNNEKMSLAKRRI
jgi:hypothetical protein